MANVLTTIEIRADSGRTREEIVQSLRAAQDAARATAVEFDRLKQKSIEETAQVNRLSQELGALNLKLAQNRDAQSSVSSQMTFFTREAASERKNLAELERQLESVTQARMHMGASASGSSAKAQQLAADEARLNKEIAQTTTSILQHSQAMATLRGKTGELATSEETLKRGVFELRNELLNERDALQRTNEAKQRSAVENQHASQTLREATGEARVFNQTIREQNREVNQLTASQAALAMTVGNLLSHAIRNTIVLMRDLIVDTTIYAARTDELGLVMTKLAQVSGISNGEILAQERAIRNLNIATQDTRQVLAQFVVSQLELSKASQLARVAQDLAVVSGTDSAESFQRLTQGIETLQIRTLRTAGVFVGLDGILDKAAKTSGRTRDSFSEQEKQALLLNEVLDFGARVTGTYEEAMNNAGKQMRSLTRIIGDAKNAVGSLTIFQGAFQLIVSGIKLVLEVVQAAPGAIVILALAFTGFGIAVLANVPIIEQWTSKIFGSSGIIRTAITDTLALGTAQRKAGADAMAAAEMHAQANATMSGGTSAPSVAATAAKGANWRTAAGAGVGVGVGAGIASYAATGDAGAAIGTGLAVGAGTAATTALMTGATAASGGVLLLVAAIGALVYALVRYSNAQKEVTYASEEDMRLMLNRIKVNTEDAKTMREQASAIEHTNNAYLRNAEELKVSHMAMTRLSLQAQTDIKNKVEQVRGTENLSDASARAVVQLQLQADALERINEQQAKSLAGKQTINILAIETATKNLADFEKQMDFALKSIQRDMALPEDQRGGFGERMESFVQLDGWETGLENMQKLYDNTFRENEITVQQQQNAYRQMGETFEQLSDKKNVYTAATEADIAAQKGEIREFAISQGWIKENNKSLDEHVNKIWESVNARRAAIEAQNSERGVRGAYEKQLSELNIKTADFTKSNVFMARSISQVAGQLDSTSRVIDKNGDAVLTWRERINASRENLLGLDETLKSNSRTQEEYNSAIAAIATRYPAIVAAIRDLRAESNQAIEGIGEDVERANARFNSARESLLEVVRSIRIGLGQGTGNADSIEQKAAQLEAVGRRLAIVRGQIESIESARINLGVDTTEAIPETRDSREQLQHSLELTIRLRDAIRESERAAKDFVFDVAQSQITATKGIISAELLAARNIADSQHARLQNEQDLTAKVIELSYERERRVKDEAAEQRSANQSYLADQLESLAKVDDENRRMVAALSFTGGQSYKLPQFSLPGGGSLSDIETPSPEAVQALTATQQTAQSTQQTALNTQNMPQTLTNMLPPAIGSSLSPLFGNVTLGVENLGTSLTAEFGKLGEIIRNNASGTSVEYASSDLTGSLATGSAYSTGGNFDVGSTWYGGNDPRFNLNTNAKFMSGVRGDTGFLRGLQTIGARYNIDPNQLAQVLYAESGFRPDAHNPDGGAHGIGQFMPSIVQGMQRRGSSVSQEGLRKSSRTEQLTWVQDYIDMKMSEHPNKRLRYGSLEDIYSIWAANAGFVGQDPTSTMYAAGSGGARANKGWQVADGRVTIGSATDFVRASVGNARQFRPTAQAMVQQTGTTTVRTPTQAELLSDAKKQVVSTIGLYQGASRQESGAGFEPIEYYRQLRQAQKSNYEGLINDSRQLRIYVSAEDKAWRESAEYKIASDNKVARSRAEAFRGSKDDLATLDSEDRLRIRESALYAQTITNQVELSRRKEFNQTFDELNRQREEDRQRNENTEQYRQTITMKFESARRQEYNKTRERLFELNAEIDTNWRQSAEYRQMLDTRVAINRRESLLNARESLDLLNREDADRVANPREYAERTGIEVEVERRRQARQTTEELERLNVLETQNWFNSVEYRQMLNERFEISRRNESQKTRDEIYNHQLEIANHDESMQNRMAEAYDKATTYRQDLDDQATLSIFENMQRIEDQQTVSNKRVEAGLVSWMAHQRGMTEIVSDAMTDTLDAAYKGIDSLIGKATNRAGDFGKIMQSLFGGFIKLGLTNIIGELSGAGKETQAKGQGFFGQLLGSFGLGNAKGATQSGTPLAPMHVPQMFVSQLYVGGTVGANIGGGSGAFGGFGGLLNNRGGGGGGLNLNAPGGTGTFSGGPAFGNSGTGLSSFQSNNPFGRQYNNVFASGAAGRQSPFSGNLFSLPADLARQGGTSIANASEPGLSSIGTRAGQTALGNVVSGGSKVATTGSTAAQLAAQGKWAQKMGGNAWGGVGGFQSGIGASMAMMLPGIGGSLGGMLGGQSMIGGIMGQVGGLALGGVGMAALMGQTAVAGMFGGGAFGGAIAGMLTNPITAVVGGALLVGAILLGRNKRRREEEKTRNQALGDSKTQLQAILKSVQRPNGMDGQTAIAQAEEIRTQYMANMSQLKDPKTRRIALESVRELDALISQIKNAATAQARRREFNDSLVSEFAGGGLVVSTGKGMVVPGMDMGYDSVPAMLRPGEVVLNKQQQASVGGAHALAAARVPGFVKQTAVAARRYADGGIVSASMPTVSTAGMGSRSQSAGNIFVVMDKKFAQDMAVAGRDKIIEMSATDIRDRGKIYSAVRKSV